MGVWVVAFDFWFLKIFIWLVICTATGRVQSTTGSLFQKSVYSSFSMKIVLNYIHIWSMDLFLVKDKVSGRKLIKMAALWFGYVPKCSCLGQRGHVWGANHTSSMEVFLGDLNHTLYNVWWWKSPAGIKRQNVWTRVWKCSICSISVIFGFFSFIFGL